MIKNTSLFAPDNVWIFSAIYFESSIRHRIFLKFYILSIKGFSIQLLSEWFCFIKFSPNADDSIHSRRFRYKNDSAFFCNSTGHGFVFMPVLMFYREIPFGKAPVQFTIDVNDRKKRIRRKLRHYKEKSNFVYFIRSAV